MIWFFLLLHLAPGEKLYYEAKFSFLHLGSMTMGIEDTMVYKDRKCYKIYSALNSNPALKVLFSLNDTITVYTTADSLLPLYYSEKINEGGYHRQTYISFDYDSLRSVYNDTITTEIHKNSRDLLSAWYYLRTVPLIPGDTIYLDIHNVRKNYCVACIIRNEEKIKVGAGDFETIPVILDTKGKGVFGSRGRMEIWYAKEGLIPVQIKASMKFGSLLFKLKEVSN